MTTIDLKERAARLGFSALGVASPDAPVHADFYKRWLDQGFGADMTYLADHAPLKRDVRNLLPQAKSVVVVALDYNQDPPEPRPGQPRIARYALGRDYHRVLRGKLKRLQREIEGVEPKSQNRVCVDSAPILERDFAHQAGLGWFGKNTCLIDSKRGSWFVLGVLLTSVQLEFDRPAVGGCGTCKICIESCPTGAILFEEGRWQVDSRKCISYLTIERRGEFEPEHDLHGWTFGCDVCQEVCPFNHPRDSQPERARRTREKDFLDVRPFPTLTELASLPYGDWDSLTQGSPVRRAGYDGLKRNALANLSSGGD